MQNTSFKNWLLAIRPKTLPAAIAPVAMGTAMALGDGIEHFPTAVLCLLGALAIQIGTNLANDYYDFKKGADTEERVGPTRVTQAGLILPNHVKTGFIIAFVFAALISVPLVMRGGLPILIVGVLAILSGLFYTAGRNPLGYLGLGELFVLIFFGPVAVAGTYYVQSLEINSAVIFSGFGPGFLSVAILAVNNLRDVDSDRKSGKNTLAVRFGRAFAISEYLACLFAAIIIPVFIYIYIQDHLAIMMCVIILFIAIPAIKRVVTTAQGFALNDALAWTAQLLLVYSVLFSIGWIL